MNEEVPPAREFVGFMLRHRAQPGNYVPSPPNERPESKTMRQSSHLRGRLTAWRRKCDPVLSLLRN